MKFAFITAAIVVLFRCVHVDGDNSDIYPGVAPEETPFSKHGEDFSPLFRDSAYAPPQLARWRSSFPWTRDRKPAVPGGLASDRIMDALHEMLEQRRQQYKMEAEKHFAYQYPNQQQPVGLEESRPYASDDVAEYPTLVNLDGDDGAYVLRDPERFYAGYDYAGHVNVPQHEGHAGSHGHSHTSSSSSSANIVPQVSAFKDVEFAKDPNEFAYLPTDPRFFQDDESNLVKSQELLDDDDVGDSAARIDQIRVAQIAPSDADYAFITSDENAQQPEQDEEAEEPEKSLEHDVDINLNHRNDATAYASEGSYGKEFLRENNDDVEVIEIRQPQLGDSTGIYVLAVIAGVSAAALVTLITLIITWFNLQKHVKNASDVEYPAYGVTGPNKEVSPSGDRRLAQSAQMYHYQHQKQQIIAMERAAANERHGSISEADSDEENEEGDYTVYECPGLAPTGEMEVKNPLFQDDPTPAQTPHQKQTDNASSVQKK